MSTEQKALASQTFVSWIRAFWELGYFHAGLSPNNILVSTNGKFTFIDHEFLQPYQTAKPEFAKAFEFEGLPEKATGYDRGYDRPITRLPKCLKHHPNWRLLPFETFISPLI
jgi:hypothetical protein